MLEADFKTIVVIIGSIIGSVIGVFKFTHWLTEQSIKQSISDFNQFQEIFYNPEKLKSLITQSKIVQDLSCKTMKITKNLTFIEILYLLQSGLNTQQVGILNTAKKKFLSFNSDELKYNFKKIESDFKFMRNRLIFLFFLYVFFVMVFCYVYNIDLNSNAYFLVLFFIAVFEIPAIIEVEKIKAAMEIKDSGLFSEIFKHQKLPPNEQERLEILVAKVLKE